MRFQLFFCVIQSIYEDDERIVRHSGRNIPNRFTSSTTQIKLVFTSDRRRTFTGFLANFYSISASKFYFFFYFFFEKKWMLYLIKEYFLNLLFILHKYTYT